MRAGCPRTADVGAPNTHEETKTQINQSSQLRQAAARGRRRRTCGHQNAFEGAGPDTFANANALSQSITHAAFARHQRHDARR